MATALSFLDHNHDLVGKMEVNLRRLAREIAMQIIDPETILKLHGLSWDQYHLIADTPSFKQLLQEEVQTWASGLNTKERVELKTWAMIEEALPQMWQYLHDPQFADNAKVALIVALQKQVGIGQRDGQVGEAGQKVSITINTGSNAVKLEDVTPQVIEGRITNETPHQP